MSEANPLKNLILNCRNRLRTARGELVAYDQEFLKVSWGFSILNTEEIAITSLNFTDITDPTFDALAAMGSLAAGVVGPLLVARMGTLLTATGLRWADYGRLNYVRIAGVQLSGLEYDPALLYEDTTPQAGTITNVLPQSSIVLSTRSGLSTGSANFGRMFLPYTQFALTATTPFADPVNVGNVATAFQVFVNGVEADLNASLIVNPVQASIMTQVIGGFSKEIQQIAVGNVTDTQRRRRNQLAETYVFRTIP